MIDLFIQKQAFLKLKVNLRLVTTPRTQKNDILINLSDSTCIPLKYLVASSIARFKVGKFEKDYDIYDLMIKLDKKEDTMEKLISEIAKYLNIINKEDSA